MISREKLEEFAILSWIELKEPIKMEIDPKINKMVRNIIEKMQDAHKKAWDSKLHFWPVDIKNN